MKLIYSPGACSLGIHVVLEEIGKPYETEAADLRQPREARPLTAINPKSKVPTLVRDDGSVLTEFPAIAYWLARNNPDAHLFPDDVEGQTRTLEALDFCVATLHMQGFARLFAARRATTPAEGEALTAQGTDVVTRGLDRVSATLGGKDWLNGAYSIADSALFYVSNWAAPFKLALPDNIAAHLARMQARPAVAAVLKAEGIA
jgi:glutathione S-transferase